MAGMTRHCNCSTAEFIITFIWFISDFPSKYYKLLRQERYRPATPRPISILHTSVPRWLSLGDMEVVWVRLGCLGWRELGSKKEGKLPLAPLLRQYLCRCWWTRWSVMLCAACIKTTPTRGGCLFFNNGLASVWYGARALCGAFVNLPTMSLSVSFEKKLSLINF